MMLNFKTYILGATSLMMIATASQASLAEQDPFAPAGGPLVAAPVAQDPVVNAPQPTVRQATKDLGNAVKAEVKPAVQAAKATYKEDVKPVVHDVKQETNVVGKKVKKEVKKGFKKLKGKK